MHSRSIFFTIPLIVLAPFAYADSAAQTNWSGGDGVWGPVPSWGAEFHQSTDVIWDEPGYISLVFTPVEHLVDGESDEACCIYAADVDGDGDMDILGAAFNDDNITWWENTDGTGTDWVEHSVDDSFNGANFVHAADVDGDGDTDVLGAAFIADVITWWENANGAGTIWVEHLVGGDFEGHHLVGER